MRGVGGGREKKENGIERKREANKREKVLPRWKSIFCYLVIEVTSHVYDILFIRSNSPGSAHTQGRGNCARV